MGRAGKGKGIPMGVEGRGSSLSFSSRYSMRGQGATQLCCGTTSCSLRGQGATEYLVVFSVVLFIVLTGVAVLGFMPDSTGDIVASESQVYWQGQAKPIRDSSASLGSGTFCGSDGTGYLLTVENADLSPLSIEGVSINGRQEGFCEPGQDGQSTAVRLEGTGAKKLLVLSSSPLSCQPGETESVDVRFDYSGQFPGQVQAGGRKLLVRCAN